MWACMYLVFVMCLGDVKEGGGGTPILPVVLPLEIKVDAVAYLIHVVGPYAQP